MSKDGPSPDEIIRDQYLCFDIMLQLTIVQKGIFKKDEGNFTELPEFTRHLEKLTPAIDALQGGKGKQYFDSELPKFYGDIEGFIEKAKKNKVDLEYICTYLKEYIGFLTASLLWIRNIGSKKTRLKYYVPFMDSLADLGVACFIKFWTEKAKLVNIGEIRRKNTQQVVDHIMEKVKERYGFEEGDESFDKQIEMYELIINCVLEDRDFETIGAIYRYLNLLIHEDSWYSLVGRYYSKQGRPGSLSGARFIAALRTIFTPALESDSPTLPTGEENAQLAFLREWLNEKEVEEGMKRILACNPTTNKIEVLEMGGGTGISAENFRVNLETALLEFVKRKGIPGFDKEKLNQYIHITTTDASKRMLKILQKNKDTEPDDPNHVGANIDFEQADAIPEGAPNDTYHAITSRLFFHHIPFAHQPIIIDRIKDVARPHAFFYGMDVTPIEPYAKMAYLPLDFACPANNRVTLGSLFEENGLVLMDNRYLAKPPGHAPIRRGVFEAAWTIIKKSII